MTKAKVENVDEKTNQVENYPIKDDLTLFQLSPAIIPDHERVITNRWGKKVANPEALITFKGNPVLRAGGKLVIKSLPKAGKTSLDESIAASLLNPDCASMGFKAKLYGRTKVLFIDTEQSEFESQESYNRIMRRAGFDLNAPEPPIEEKRLIHVNYKRLFPDEMIAELTKTLKANPEVGLVIFDVITDFADDGVMEMKDALTVLRFLNSLNEEIGILCNIHVNEGEAVKKPSRGHLGRELERKCSACIYLSKKDNDVMQIEASLMRSNGSMEPVYCKWDNELNLFVETDYQETNKVKDIDKAINEVGKMFSGSSERSTESLLKAFNSIHPGTSRNNFNYYMRKYKDCNLIENTGKKGYWRIIANV